MFNDTKMYTETSIEELDRQAVYNQSALSSNSDDNQLGTNYNLAPTEHTAIRSINGTADGSRVVAVNSSLPVPPAATNPTEEAHVEAPNPMPDGNALYKAMVDQSPIQESVGDEHDGQNLIIPMPL